MRQYHSRLQQVEEQKSIKTALIFGGLTVVIIVAAIFFGIPAFSKFINLFNRNSAQSQTKNNAVTLHTPSLANLPQYTNQQSIIVKGTSSPNATVKVFFNDSSDETSTDNDGNFAINVSLTKGANTIFAQTIDSSGNASVNSNSYIVNFSNQVPNLTVNSPQNNQTFYGSTQQLLTVQGSTDINNTVTINEHIAVVDPAGKFSYPFNLQNGDNNLKIISQDQAGNKKEIDLKVTFNP